MEGFREEVALMMAGLVCPPFAGGKFSSREDVEAGHNRGDLPYMTVLEGSKMSKE